MHAILFIMLLLVAVVGTALLFVFWLVVTILRGITRLVLGPGMKKPPRVGVFDCAVAGPRMKNPPPLPTRDPPNTRRCCRDSCRALNPVEARYCRRCGQPLEDPQHVAVRRAAMF